MNTIARKLLVAGGVLLLVVGVAAALLLSRLDRIIQSGVETEGPPITGTTVVLGGAHVSLFSGEGTLRDLQIGNPAGFGSTHSFELGEIALKLEPRSVTGDVVHIQSVHIKNPHLTAEFDAEGRDNLRAILEHAGQAAQSPAPAPSGSAESKPKRIIIDHLVVEDAEVHVLAPLAKLDKTLKLPTLELKDLGGREGGTPAQIGKQVLSPVIGATVRAARAQYLDAAAAGWTDKLKNKLGNLFGGSDSQ